MQLNNIRLKFLHKISNLDVRLFREWYTKWRLAEMMKFMLYNVYTYIKFFTSLELDILCGIKDFSVLFSSCLTLIKIPVRGIKQ